MELNKKRNGFLRTSIRQVDEENLRITHTINTKALDRYSTIVLPTGADAKHFMNNAVVLWSHNMDEATPKIPIGKCVDLEIRDDEIVATTEFNKNDPLAVKVFNAYRDGFLHAWSIGFMPLKYKRFDEENMEDLNKKYGLKVTKADIDDAGFWGVYLIYKWELLEYSAVPVPGNPEALSADGAEQYKRELVTRGLVDENSAKDMDVRKLLKRNEDEQSSEEATEGNEESTETETPDENTSEEQSEGTEEETTEGEESTEDAENSEEETPGEEEASQEETETTEGESEENAEEAEETTSEENAEEQAEDNAEAEETDGEGAEENSEEAQESDESTQDGSEESESVAEGTDEENEGEQDTNEERQALEQKVDDLTQRNQELSERLAKMEEKVNELSKINQTLTEIKESLDVDNIEKVRDAAQKRKGQNPDTWFSNYLRGNR